MRGGTLPVGSASKVGSKIRLVSIFHSISNQFYYDRSLNLPSRIIPMFFDLNVCTWMRAPGNLELDIWDRSFRSQRWPFSSFWRPYPWRSVVRYRAVLQARSIQRNDTVESFVRSLARFEITIEALTFIVVELFVGLDFCTWMRAPGSLVPDTRVRSFRSSGGSFSWNWYPYPWCLVVRYRAVLQFF